MRLLRLISNRIFIVSLLLVAQIIWFIVFLVKLTNYSLVISTLFSLLSLIMVLFILVKEDNPSYKISWIILIMALPLFGGLFYLLFGNKTPSRGIRYLLDLEKEKVRELLDYDPQILEAIAKENPRAMTTFSYLQEANAFPVYKNTESDYYASGEAMFRDMLEEMKEAKNYIFMEYFILEDGKMWAAMIEILAEKASQGVDVRLIYDDVGSLFLLDKAFVKSVEDQGIKVLAFNQFRPFLSLAMNNRNHRKMLVIDGHVAFTGGINIADEYINEKERFGYWKDTGIRLKGEAAWAFTLMFLEMWNAFRKTDDDFAPFKACPQTLSQYKSDGYLQPYSDSPLDDETVGENIYIDILDQAKDYVYIFTPYLIIDNEMKHALTMAAKRGVDVSIVTPGIPDKKLIFRLTRSNYEPLLKAGVKIFEYSPGFLHGKSYVADDEIGVVGTINMDYRSLYLHFECGVLLFKNQSLLDLRDDSLATISQSKEITLDQIKRGLPARFADALLRLIAPLT